MKLGLENVTLMKSREGRRKLKPSNTELGNKKEVNLEENSFSMVALSTSDSFCARECWIRSNILQNLSAFPYGVMNLIPIDTVIVSNFLQTEI